jgi:hypothetical protein
MVCFQTKNTNLDKFWRVLRWKMLAYFMAIWSILRPSGIFYGFLVYFKVIWYILPVLVSCIKKNLATLLRVPSSLWLKEMVKRSSNRKLFLVKTFCDTYIHTYIIHTYIHYYILITQIIHLKFLRKVRHVTYRQCF